MAKSRGSLKSALSRQQVRLTKKAKDKAQEAALVHEKTKSRGKGKNDKGKEKVNPTDATTRILKSSTIPFRTTDTILLVGEGNFSFAAALFKHPALEHLPSSNITATAYDTEEDCINKYPDAKENIDFLKERGAQVLFGVDATALEKCKLLKGKRFDRVVWNFPHAGKGITDQDRNILSNQMLLVGFLRSVAQFLSLGPVPSVQGSGKKSKSKGRTSSVGSEEESDGEGGNDDTMSDIKETVSTTKASSGGRCRGTVLVTLRNVHPYTDWKLSDLAKKPPPPIPPATVKNPVYIQLRSFVFRRSEWPGYEHRMTKGERAHGAGTTGIGGEDRTWEFCLRIP